MADEEELPRLPSSLATKIDHASFEESIAQSVAQYEQTQDLKKATESLLVLEKQCRMAADAPAGKKVVAALLNVTRASNDWKAMNDILLLMSKRRSQLKQVISAMVQQAMPYIDETPDKTAREDMIKTLITVTSGKIYVEIERARLTKMHARMKEEEGNLKEASEVIQQVAVETFGAMAKTERVAFILEQVRLCLDCEDYSKAQILAKKINPRVFTSKSGDRKKKGGSSSGAGTGEAGSGSGGTTEKGEGEGGEAGEEKKKKKVEDAHTEEEAPAAGTPSLLELKIQYYQLMIRYYGHTSDFIEMARAFQHIYQTPPVSEDPSLYVEVLTYLCWCLVLAPLDSLRVSLLHSTLKDTRLAEHLPTLKVLLKHFVTVEVVAWSPLVFEYAPALKQLATTLDPSAKKDLVEDFKLRIAQHNISVIAKYYSRIRMARLAEQLGLSAEEAELQVSNMVTSHALTAKIDRPAGIVTFRFNQSQEDLLNNWSNSIEKLLGLVETSCHKIHKEMMVYKMAV